MIDDLFEKARAVDVAKLVADEGVTLRRSGGRYTGPCPLCGGDKGSTRLSINKNLWKCFACGEGGSAIDMEKALRGGETLDAAKRLAGDDAPPRPAVPLRRFSSEAPKRSTLGMAQRLWREAPMTARVAELAINWFEARGLPFAHVQRALDRLRFHPSAFMAGERGPFGKWKWICTAPAILAPIIDTNAGGKLIGVHATYLSADGREKAQRQTPEGHEIPARKMWGRSQGGVVALTHLRPSDPSGNVMVEPLFVGEGLETTLTSVAYWSARDIIVRAAATLSLDNLQGHWLTDDDGAMIDGGSLDPERMPWTLPNAGYVVNIIDRDMADIRIKVATPQGPKRVTYDGEMRAALCARLARQAWERAGATTIETALPLKAGADLNDMARAA